VLLTSARLHKRFRDEVNKTEACENACCSIPTQADVLFMVAARM
jgi:hypothetical protein